MGREWILRIRRIDELEARVSNLFDHPTLGVGAMGKGGDFGSGLPSSDHSVASSTLARGSMPSGRVSTPGSAG
jgi:hypothetical protein